MVAYVLERAERVEPLSIEDGTLRWAGPSDPEEDAPLLRFECPIASGEEVGDLVARYPMPAMLVAALAERFVDVSLDVGDVRWRYALAAARIARGEAVEPPATGEVIQVGSTDARCLPDGTLVVLHAGKLRIGPRELELPRAFASPTARLPRPAAIDPFLVAVVARDGGTVALAVYDRDGQVVGHGTAPVKGEVLTVSREPRGFWVHTGATDVLLGPSGARGDMSDVGLRAMWRSQLVMANRHAVCAGEVWRSFPGNAHVATDEAIWIATLDGIYQWDATSDPPVRVLEAPARAMCVEGRRMWSACDEVLVAFDRVTLQVEVRVELPFAVTSLAWTAGRILARNTTKGSEAWAVLDLQGAILATLEGPGAGHAALPDGSLAVGASRDILVVHADEAIARTIPRSFGKFVGVTRDRFIVAEPKRGLYAFDRAGRVTSQLPAARPCEVDDTSVYAIADGALVRWDPRGGGGIDPPPRPRAIARGQTITVLHAKEGEITTCVDCTLDRVSFAQHGTLIAIGCDAPSVAWTHPSKWLALVDCRKYD